MLARVCTDAGSNAACRAVQMGLEVSVALGRMQPACTTCSLRPRGLAYSRPTVPAVAFLFKSTLNVLLLHVRSQQGKCAPYRAMGPLKPAAAGLGLSGVISQSHP